MRVDGEQRLGGSSSSAARSASSSSSDSSRERGGGGRGRGASTSDLPPCTGDAGSSSCRWVRVPWGRGGWVRVPWGRGGWVRVPWGSGALAPPPAPRRRASGGQPTYHTTHGTEPTPDSRLWRCGTRSVRRSEARPAHQRTRRRLAATLQSTLSPRTAPTRMARPTPSPDSTNEQLGPPRRGRGGAPSARSSPDLSPGASRLDRAEVEEEHPVLAPRAFEPQRDRLPGRRDQPRSAEISRDQPRSAQISPD